MLGVFGHIGRGVPETIFLLSAVDVNGAEVECGTLGSPSTAKTHIVAFQIGAVN
jgi:hypothetical protein